MNGLAALQQAFQTALLEAEDTLLTGLAAGPAGAAIYLNGYRARLEEVLSLDFPIVQSVLGAAAFAELSRRYIAARPSRSRSIRWFGAGFADYLAARTDYAHAAWLADLARFEWALGRAFDAVDAPSLDPVELRAIPAAEWAGLRFHCDAAAQCLALAWNAPAIHAALAHGEAMPAPVRDARHWLVWRHQHAVRYKPVPPDYASALATVQAGASMAELCARLQEAAPQTPVAARAVELLGDWLALGLIAAVTNAPPPATVAATTRYGVTHQ